MIWPPLKAWTSKFSINEQIHFVAINYGGELLNRWVVLMSVLDSSVIIKVSWLQLVDLSYWESGWVERKYVEPYKLVDYKGDLINADSCHPSNDSGLTIPISKNKIRPWVDKI